MWNKISNQLPPDGVKVLTKVDDFNGERNVQYLTRKGHLYWGSDMYVYYTPTHWKL